MTSSLRISFVVLTANMTLSCSKPEVAPQPLHGEIFTLYGTTDGKRRFHEATLDAALNVGGNGLADNEENCRIMALILNANMKAEAGGRQSNVGFWCEPGRYRAQGSVPSLFKGKFPLDL